MTSKWIAAALAATAAMGSGTARAGYLPGYGTVVTLDDRLHLGIDGEGYFLLTDGATDVLVREGRFEVGPGLFVIDQAYPTRFRLQRTGSYGESWGFQAPGRRDIRIPYNVPIPPRPTTAIDYGGNLSADETVTTTHTLNSGIEYTVHGIVATEGSLLADLDQGGSTLQNGDQIDVAVRRRDGTETTASVTVTPGTTTFSHLLTEIDTLLGCQAHVMINSGKIYVQDKQSGYSQIDVTLKMNAAASGALELLGYFPVETPGGTASRDTTVEIFDCQGVSHVLNGSFVRRDSNLWDMVIRAVTGDVKLLDRRIEGITFNADGSYGGLDALIGDAPVFQVGFACDEYAAKTIMADLGMVGGFGGLSQFGGPSTAWAAGQDGYPAGWLAKMWVTGEGLLVGEFTNDLRADIAKIAVVVVPEPSSLLLLAVSALAPLRRRARR